jgi:osmotically inducible protein OsmC
MADRSADARWQGNLARGSGQVTLASSGAGTFEVSWPARTEQPNGKTSPEELIAAAHASCFSMALSNELSKAGGTVNQLDVSATVTLEQGDGGFSITRSRLTVRGDVDGLDDDEFQAAANGAKAGCPVSKALAGNVEIELDASRR